MLRWLVVYEDAVIHSKAVNPFKWTAGLLKFKQSLIVFDEVYLQVFILKT